MEHIRTEQPTAEASRYIPDLEEINSAYLASKIKEPAHPGYGRLADVSAKMWFIAGSIVSVLTLAKDLLGVAGILIAMCTPLINFLWNFSDGSTAVAAGRTTEKEEIRNAKTRIKQKKTTSSMNVATGELLLVTNVVTILTDPILQVGLSPLLSAIFLPMAPFAFFLGMCSCFYKSLLDFWETWKKCDPEHLLQDRFEKAAHLKLNISKLESDLKKQASGNEKHKKKAQALYKSKRELARLELQQVALAKKIIFRDKANPDQQKAEELAKLFRANHYPEMTQTELLKPPTPAEESLADYLIEKQREEVDTKLFDTVAWFGAVVGMGLGSFALVFLHVALLVSCVAVIFLALASAMKAYQLLGYGTPERTPLLVMKDKIAQEFYVRYFDPPEGTQGTELLPVGIRYLSKEKEGLEGTTLLQGTNRKFDQVCCLAAWELCKQRVRDEQMVKVREAITEKDPALKASMVAEHMKAIDIRLAERFDEMQGDFFNEILHKKTPKQREKYLTQAFEEYAQRRVLESVAERINSELLGKEDDPYMAEQYYHEFIDGLSKGDRGRIAKGESALSAHITSSRFLGKETLNAKRPAPAPAVVEIDPEAQEIIDKNPDWLSAIKVPSQNSL